MAIPFRKIEKVLDSYPAKIERNTFTDKLEINRRPLTDRDLHKIIVWLDAKKLDVSKERLDIVLDASQIRDYHPFEEVIGKHKGAKPSGLIRAYAKRINTNFGLIGEGNFLPNLWPEIFEKWFVGMYAAQQKGNEIPNVIFPIIIGGQGVGKTYWVRNILPNSLKIYLTNITIKDVVSTDRAILNALGGNAIALDDEFGHFATNTSESLKTLLSSISQDVDQKYKRNLEPVIRRASLIATSNTSEHLKDVTGNRRLVAIQAESIDWLDYRKATKEELETEEKNKELMWLEAKNLYLNKYDFEVSTNEFKFINSQMLENREHKSEYDIIDAYCIAAKDNENYAVVTLYEVLQVFNEVTNFKVYDGNIQRGLMRKGISWGKWDVKKGKRRKGYRLNTSSLILELLINKEGFSQNFRRDIE